MIQKIFKNQNTQTLSGPYVVEQLIPYVGAPKIAEEYIMEMIKAGTLIQDGKNLILNLPSEIKPTEPEPESENEKIKKGWFYLRQKEKENPSPEEFKIYVESFVRKYGWNYYVLNKQLRESLEELGYHSVQEERSLFQKEVLQS